MTSLNAFEQRLRQPLPGPEAHISMAAMPSLPAIDRVRSSAAVLVLLSPCGYRVPERACDLLVTLIRRATGGQHGLELAFPGGLQHDGESCVDTALREASEEIGLDPRRVTLLGQLSPVTTVLSAVEIFPVVGMTRYFPELFPNEEVDSILQTPLRTLARSDARGIKVVDNAEVGRRRIPHFLIGNEELWGASAMIMAELMTLVYGDRFFDH